MSDSMLVVYQAHPVTGEYIGPSNADPDPLEDGNWLIPAMAFAEAPPRPKAGFAVAHMPDADQVWSLVPDFRGVVYQTADGEALLWEKLGLLPDGLTNKVPPGAYCKWVDGDWEIDSAGEANALTTQALSVRDALLAEATTRIAPLQDAVDLGDASGGEEEELEAWKRYRIALNRVQRQAAFPAAIEWPTPPVTHNSQ